MHTHVHLPVPFIFRSHSQKFCYIQFHYIHFTSYTVRDLYLNQIMVQNISSQCIDTSHEQYEQQNITINKQPIVCLHARRACVCVRVFEILFPSVQNFPSPNIMAYSVSTFLICISIAFISQFNHLQQQASHFILIAFELQFKPFTMTELAIRFHFPVFTNCEQDVSC